jgi:hypothetical protein
MHTDEEVRTQLRECFRVIDTCLECIYDKKSHMYRPLAAQLRILLCDTNRGKEASLLPRVFPSIEIQRIGDISWSDTGCGPVALMQPLTMHARISMMPFEITRYQNGLVVADFLAGSQKFLPLAQWMSQDITLNPIPITPREVIRHVADKGGGAHVDARASAELRYLMQRTPFGQTFGELFILALGRLAQSIGEARFQYKGVKVPESLLRGARTVANQMVVAHVEWADAMSNRTADQ